MPPFRTAAYPRWIDLRLIGRILIRLGSSSLAHFRVNPNHEELEDRIRSPEPAVCAGVRIMRERTPSHAFAVIRTTAMHDRMPEQ